MPSPRFLLPPLIAALAAIAVPPGVAGTDPETETETETETEAAPSPAHETVELRWPDGTLRERRLVLRLPDGTTVDDGPFERWFRDGTKEYEAVFVRGRKEGETVRYHDNGRVASRQFYRNGERHGPSVSWNRDGDKVKEERWRDGRPHGTWTVWEDGRVAWAHTFEDGDPDPRGVGGGQGER